MWIFLAGVSCVGKTTVGERLAGCLGYRFLDVDVEIERFFGTSIGHLQERYPASHDFRRMAAQALKQVLSCDDGRNCVVALPPSGLMGSYWRVVKETRDAIIVVLRDTPENILGRITFYDTDSRPVPTKLTDREKSFHLREIKRDIAYFGRSYARPLLSVDIAGCTPDEASHKVMDALRLRVRALAPGPR
jgi:shikimate kinase